MYGDRSGSAGGAELLYVVFLHAVQLNPGKPEAVL